MAQIVEIALADLLVDPRNARLTEEQPSQQSTLLAIARQQGKRLLKLANDIVEYGLDPTALPAVVATNDQRKRYLVIEGNRRVVALKSLETPSLIASAFDAKDKKKLQRLAEQFAQKPIATISCSLFDNEKELAHWVTIRHTGQNEGVGLVEWGAEEKDRYSTRYGQRSPAGQILDFVDKCGLLSDAAQQSKKEVISNLVRLISSPVLREKVGINISNGKVQMLYPASEVAKSLTHIVEDLKTEKIKVADIYNKDARTAYAEALTLNVLPEPTKRLGTPVTLGSETKTATPSVKTKQKEKPRKLQTERTVLIPQGCQLNITLPRINLIYNELSTLSADQYPNACSVLLRVFIELSVDNYIIENSIMSDDERKNQKLAKRLKDVAADLKSKNKIDSQLEIAAQKIADSKFILAASTITFNQYVHNQFVFPKATELRMAWDELQPFVEKLWP